MSEAVGFDTSRFDSLGATRLESARPAQGAFGYGQWEILERIARGGSLAELLLSIVGLVEHQAENMLCTILIFDPVTNQLRHGAARRFSPDLCTYIDGLRIGPDVGSCGAAAFHQRPVIVTDIATHPSWEPFRARFLEQGLRACWSTPILSPARELLGTLAMYFVEPRGPSDEECGWADAATHLAAIALTRARAERENDRLLRTLEQRVKELTLLHRSTRLLQSPEVPIARQLAELVAMIPNGWRFPDLCRARIAWGDVEVHTPGFAETAWKQVARAPAGARSVRLEVVYLREVPPTPEGPFAAEERALLESLADVIGAHLEKHHAEAALTAAFSELRDKNQRLEFHVSRMPLGYVVWDGRRRVVEWNGSAEQIFGWAAADVVGKPSSQLPICAPHELQRDPIGDELVASQGGGSSSTHEHTRKDGARVVCEWLHAPLTDGGGGVVGYLSMAHDVTERQRAEEERARLEGQLRQGQRIQALGTLAGGIAHDFNNILTAISGHTHLGLNDIEEERSPLDSLLAIQEASTRAVELVRRILMFSRYQQPERKLCSIVPIIEESVQLLRGSVPPGVRVELELPAEQPLVFADPAQLHTIVVNLGANASYAIGETGTIRVALDSIPSTHEELASCADRRFDRYARLSVSDTGLGMDDATVQRIFEPFFTTKPTGQGNGLGLSVVHGIVKGHEGCIAVHSQPGRGSVFRIYLPQSREAPARPALPSRPARPSAARPAGSTPRVMYVDDEEPLVVLAMRWLRRLGYEVTGFSDSTQALEAFRARPLDFDALISDISMPGLSGLDLVREVRALRKDVMVVLSSGYLRHEDQQRAKELGAVDVVVKPQSMAEFGRILHRILSDRRSESPAQALPANGEAADPVS
jgi:PAS domain S-box-containing protein